MSTPPRLLTTLTLMLLPAFAIVAILLLSNPTAPTASAQPLGRNITQVVDFQRDGIAPRDEITTVIGIDTNSHTIAARDEITTVIGIDDDGSLNVIVLPRRIR